MNLLFLLQFLHITAMASGIGGIFFMDLFLFPVIRQRMPDAPARLQLLYQIFRLFFAWVWLAGATLLITGYATVFRYGGFAALNTAMWVMVVLGTLMVVLALYVFFVPFLRMRRSVHAADWPGAGRAAAQIRLLSSVNLVLAVPTLVAGVWAIYA